MIVGNKSDMGGWVGWGGGGGGGGGGGWVVMRGDGQDGGGGWGKMERIAIGLWINFIIIHEQFSHN